MLQFFDFIVVPSQFLVVLACGLRKTKLDILRVLSLLQPVNLDQCFFYPQIELSFLLFCFLLLLESLDILFNIFQHQFVLLFMFSHIPVQGIQLAFNSL